jgi:hypothetical protein
MLFSRKDEKITKPLKFLGERLASLASLSPTHLEKSQVYKQGRPAIALD